MSEHTPGPWRVPRHAPWQVTEANALLGDTVLAEAHESVLEGRRGKEERNANARPIAASPTLLSELRAAAEEFGVLEYLELERGNEQRAGRHRYWADRLLGTTREAEGRDAS